MISVAVDFYGAELQLSNIDKTITAVMEAARELRGGFEFGKSPAVHVVFCVPGSLGGPDWDYGRYGTFVEKEQLLTIEVAVSPEIISSESPLDDLIKELHGANALAFEFFRQRSMEYPLREAECLVVEIRRKTSKS